MSALFVMPCVYILDVDSRNHYEKTGLPQVGVATRSLKLFAYVSQT